MNSELNTRCKNESKKSKEEQKQSILLIGGFKYCKKQKRKLLPAMSSGKQKIKATDLIWLSKMQQKYKSIKTQHYNMYTESER